MQSLQAAQSAGAAAEKTLGAKAVFSYQATQATVLAPSVCLAPGVLDEAIVSAYVNGLFTWCGAPASAVLVPLVFLISAVLSTPSCCPASIMCFA